MNKNANFFERLIELADHFGLEGIPALSDKLGYHSPEKLYRLGRGNKNKPSFDIIMDLTNKFDNLNLNWLLRGEGEIELPRKRSNISLNAAEPPGQYAKSEDYKLTETLMRMFGKEVAKQLEPMLQEQSSALADIHKLLLKSQITDGLEGLERQILAKAAKKKAPR